jgi:hypothetical protein
MLVSIASAGRRVVVDLRIGGSERVMDRVGPRAATPDADVAELGGRYRTTTRRSNGSSNDVAVVQPSWWAAAFEGLRYWRPVGLSRDEGASGRAEVR